MTKEKKKINLSITNPRVFNAIKTFISLLIALVVTFIVLVFISDDPVTGFKTILFGPLEKARYLGIVIEKTVPYAFAGLCCGLLFKMGFFNLGAEGIYIMSGVACTAMALVEMSSNILHPIICIAIAAVVGGVLMVIPAFLKAKYGANEMVISLMLNSIYLGISNFIIRNTMATTTRSNFYYSQDFLPSAKIGYLIEKYHISACFILLLVVTLLIHLMLKKTKLGYAIRITGTNPRFAEYSGINSFKLSMTVNFLAGVLAGIGSGSVLLTQYAFYQWNNSPGIGFSGSLMAMLGGNNPFSILISSFFIQYLEEGTTILYRFDKAVPSEIVAIVEGVMVLLISSQYFLRGLREKKLLKEGLENDK